jgi:hypothetical protein
MAHGKPKLCQFGNCEETRPDVSVSYHGQRVSFCCVDHAALWLLRQQFPRAGIILDWANGTAIWSRDHARAEQP